MKKKLSIVSFLSILSLAATVILVPFRVSATSQIDMDNPNISYIGRWEKSDSGKTARAYFESSLEFKFTGNEVSVNVEDISAGFIYSIDRSEYSEVTEKKGIIVLKKGLSSGEHTLKICSKFENSRFALSGFILSDRGTLLQPENKKMIEFIGDSITAGWIGGSNAVAGYKYSYALLTTDKMGLYGNSVAYSGLGLLKSTGNDTISMNKRYFCTKQYQTGESSWDTWDTGSYIPNYIVLNIGTNDSAKSDEFQNGYFNFLSSLRSNYSSATIFAVAPFCGKYRLQISNAVAEMNLKGDHKIVFIDTYNWITGTDTTDEVHPTINAQESVADLLAETIDSYIKNPGTDGRSKSVSLDDIGINYIGRCVISPDKSYVTLNFESGMEIRFTGTHISFEFSGRFIYSVDGGEYVDIKATGPDIYNGIYGLSNGTHTVKIYSRFEAERTRISHIKIDKSGKILSRISKPKIEFIGDNSIAGWIGGSTKQYGFNFSHALLTGELLGYSQNAVAYTGIRLIADGGSDWLGMENRYFKAQNYVLNETNVPDWNTQEYIPDYIVINLGTNDRATSDVFSSHYKEFIQKLRSFYPNTVIIAVTPFGGRYKSEISDTVKKMNSSMVKCISTEGWISGINTTDETNLTIDAQIIVAKKLANAIVACLQKSNNDKTVSGYKENSDSIGKSYIDDNLDPEELEQIISNDSGAKEVEKPIASKLIDNGKKWVVNKTLIIVAILFVGAAVIIFFVPFIVILIRKMKSKILRKGRV